MLEHIGDALGANFCQDDVKKCSKLLKIARILSLASARTQICVLTVCQQQRWQVLEHCANSRIRAGVGPKSVLTVDVGVLTLERKPWCLVTQTGSAFRFEHAPSASAYPLNPLTLLSPPRRSRTPLIVHFARAGGHALFTVAG